MISPMMREVLERRFCQGSPADDSGPRFGGTGPDLVLIDGGGRGPAERGARVCWKNMGIEDVCLVGPSAKGPASWPAGGREVLHLMDGARTDAGRSTTRCCSTSSGCGTRCIGFAIGAASGKKRSKAITVSSLDEVPGIGAHRGKEKRC